MEVFGHLELILPFCWQQLTKAPHQRGHSWRTAVIANSVGQRVLQRTVVLRKANASSRLLRFYTDLRSTKIQPLSKNSAFSWLFYDPRKQIQIRMQSKAYLLELHKANEVWEQVNPRTIRDYAAIAAPGTILPAADSYLPEKDEAEILQLARQNFAVLDCIISELEFLQLHREGHRRAIFYWDEKSKDWEGSWLVP